jgi:bifunctional non-homologous end joining protein LigD
VLEEAPQSVVSGRTIREIAEGRGRKRVWQSGRTGREKKAAKPSGAGSAKTSGRRGSAGRRRSRSRTPRKAAASAAQKKPTKKSRALRPKPKRTSKPLGPSRRKAPASAGGHETKRTGATGVKAGTGGAGQGDVRLTHPDRVYWVDVGVTKQDLADYYRAVWDWMKPQVAGRPLAMVRCPEGTKGQCFFQKHASAGLDSTALRTVIDGKGRQVVAIDDLAGLLSLVQAGVLEIHVRGAMIDRIVFDLDPGEGVGWSDLVKAARDVRDRLAGRNLESFAKLSGGKGVHVVLPIEGTDWDSAKSFAQAIALAMAADEPDRYVAKITKSLRKGKIFIDYLRNSLEQTSVAAYSTRARAGAPVCVPITWQELGRTTSADQYSVGDLMTRLNRLKQDPWESIGRMRQKLPDAGPQKRGV